eukprot:gene37700-46510_t
MAGSGVDVMVVDNKGRNILQLAILGQMQLLVRLFSDPKTLGLNHYGLLAHVDDDGRNILHYIALQGVHPEMLQELLDTIGHTSAQIVEDLLLKGDSKGRIPLEYAFVFKRDRITAQLFTPTLHQMSKRFSHRFADSFMCQVGQTACLEHMKSVLTIKGLTLFSWPLDPQEVSFFERLLREFASEGFEQCVEWLMDGPWKLLERLPQAITNPAEFLNKLLVQSLQFNHPSYLTYVKKEDIPLVREKLKLEMYTVLKDWDGKTPPGAFLQDLVLRWRPTRLAGKCRPRLSDPYFKHLSDEYQHDLFETYINEYSLMSTGTAPNKQPVFELLIRKADLVGGAKVPLQMFILQEQPRLLAWYVAHYKIDLQAPLSSDADLLAFAQDQPWTHNADGVFQSGLTIDQFFWFLIYTGEGVNSFTGGYHQYNKVKWDTNFAFNGFNLMQHAAAAGSYIIIKLARVRAHVKWVVLLDNDVNAFHVAMQRNQQHVVEYLFPFFQNDLSPARGEDFTTAYYARGTTVPSLLTYAEDMIVFQRWLDVRELITTESISAKSLKPMMVIDDFFHFDFETHKEEAGSAEVTLMEDSVCHGRIDVCSWICELYAASDENTTTRDRALIAHLHRMCDLALEAKVSNWAKIGAYLRYFASKVRSSSPRKAAVLLQSCVRRHFTQRRYQHYRGKCYSAWQQFKRAWGVVLD